MPDPKLALPVRTELRLGKHVVVDAHGKRVAGAEAFDDSAKAGALASTINGAWKDAKASRRAKGGPAITETRLSRALGELEELSWPHHGPRLNMKFDPRQHPHDRLGRFTDVLAKLRQSGHGSTVELPHGVRVRKALAGFEVEHPGGKRRLSSDSGAAVEALAHLDAGDVADGALDPDVAFRGRMAELRQARKGAMTGMASDVDHVEDLMRSERVRRSERAGRLVVPHHHGRTKHSRDAYRSSHPAPDMTTLLRNANEITSAMQRLNTRRAT